MLDDGAVGQRCADLVAPFEDVHRVEQAIEAQDLQPALDWISKCESQASALFQVCDQPAFTSSLENIT
eukprot:6178099-Pleurochrysis_carterae.AAC.2